MRPDQHTVWPPTSLTNLRKKAAAKKIKKYIFFKTALSIQRYESH
jgi:hypothetical protein